MNNLTVLNYQTKDVRMVMRNNEPWWVLKDVCDVLGLSNPTMIADRLDEDERAKFDLGRQGEANIINEPGLYNVILRSDKPEAKAFKRWVTHEVLPSIRKTGSYTSPEADATKVMLAEAKRNNARARAASVWLKIASLTESHDYRQICASYASVELAGERVLPLPASTERHYTAHEVGQRYGVSANMIGRIANAHGLKAAEFGRFFLDKAKHANKTVETFMYNERGMNRIAEFVGK